MMMLLRITIVLRNVLVINKLRLSNVSRRLFFSFLMCGFSTLVPAQCPSVESYVVNACGNERKDELVIIHSGTNGFNTSHLQLNFDNNNNIFGPQNNDIHTNQGNNPSNPTPCGLVAGDVSLISGCPKVMSVGEDMLVPPNSILIVQIGNAAEQVYDFSALCELGTCVYVTKNACDRSLGAFSNFGDGERTLVVSLIDGSGCSQTCTYDRSLLDKNDGAYFAPALSGNMQYGNAGCKAPPIVNLPMAPFAFAGNDTSICIKETMVVHLNGIVSGSAISALWSGGAGDFNDIHLLDAEYYPTLDEIVDGEVSLTLTTNQLDGSGNCMSGTSTITVQFDSLPVDIEPVTAYNGYGVACAKDSNGIIQALVSGGVAPFDYWWNIGENKGVNSGLAAGEYRVTVVDNDGCIGTSAIQLAEPEKIVTDLSFMPESCKGDFGQITIHEIEGGVGPFELYVDGSFLASLSNGPTSFVEDVSAGVHSVEVVDASFCKEKIAFFIDEGYDFNIDVGADILINQGDDVEIILSHDNANSIASIVWTVDSLLDCSNCQSIQLSPLFPARVQVEAIDINGCRAYDELQIFVKQLGLYIPNVFSPNDDGINDLLTLHPSNQVLEVEFFTLYDRYGSQIVHFEHEEMQGTMNLWDGYYQGELMESQVFFYNYRVTFLDGRSDEHQGSITLVR